MYKKGQDPILKGYKKTDFQAGIILHIFPLHVSTPHPNNSVLKKDLSLCLQTPGSAMLIFCCKYSGAWHKYQYYLPKGIIGSTALRCLLSQLISLGRCKVMFVICNLLPMTWYAEAISLISRSKLSIRSCWDWIVFDGVKYQHLKTR